MIISIQLAVETAITALENSKIEDAKKFLEQILKDSQRMTLLLTDLLDLSQLETNSPEKDIVNLKMIIESEVGYLSDVNKQRVKFEGEDIDFYIDPSDFSLIVRNLLRNACNYSDKEVLISLQQTHNLVELTIEDFGRGISIADQQRVFERFYRVDKGRSRKIMRNLSF